MTSLPTTLSVLLAVIVGATLVQVLNSLENRLRGKTNQAGLLDSLLPDDHVKYWDFVWMAVPPVAGGMLLAFWPGVNGGVAGAAGFFAAFLMWVQFLDRLSAGALYRPAKYGLATLLVIGGLYFNRERVRIGRDAHGLKRELVIEETPSQPLTRDA